MTPTEQMDRIVHDTIKDMLTMTDATEINAKATAGISALDMVIVTTMDEQDALIANKQAIGHTQLQIGLAQRAEALEELSKRAKNITAAGQLMDEAAANNILIKAAEAGSAAAATIDSVATTIKALGTALETLGDDDNELDAASLSEKINDTLDKLNSLKDL